jgi:ribonuclease E
VPFAAAAIPGVIAEENDSDDEETEEQPGAVRSDQAAGGERRPRRRGRRGGRRRRGGPEDGLAGSIADELGPTPVPEVTSAVADFDNYSSAPSQPAVQPEPMAPPPEQPHLDRRPQETTATAPEAETAQEAERAAARRRSTVREKVSFLVNAQPDATAPVSHSPPQPPTAEPVPAEPASDATDGRPRRAGWWSRRFGNGE